MCVYIEIRLIGLDSYKGRPSSGDPALLSPKVIFSCYFVVLRGLADSVDDRRRVHARIRAPSLGDGAGG